MDGYSNHEDKRTDLANGVTLCKKCHVQYHQQYGRKGANEHEFYCWLNLHNRTK